MGIQIPDFVGLAHGLYGPVVFLVMALILFKLVMGIVKSVAHSPLALSGPPPTGAGSTGAVFICFDEVKEGGQ